LRPSERLTAAHTDAQAVAAAFAGEAGPGRLFAGKHVTSLLNRDATASAIRAALGTLAAMGPDDLAVVFLSGHGFKNGDEGAMVFLTTEAERVKRLGFSGTIGWDEIATQLASVRGRVLLLLDACHAGHLSPEEIVPNGELAAALTNAGRSGVLVFAASKGRQESHELNGKGLFSGALLDAMRSPAADRDGNGFLELSEMIDAVTVDVDRTTAGRQTPWVAKRELFGDFRIAMPDR